MDLDALTGADLTYVVFDLNGDKNFNDKDTSQTTMPDGSTQSDPGGLQIDMSTGSSVVSDNNLDVVISPTPDGTCATNPSACTNNHVNHGPGATGRQSWRQLR